MSQNYQAFLDERCEKLGTNHNDNSFSIRSFLERKNPVKSAVFYWLFLGEVSPRNFPWHRPIFLRICPWKSCEIWLFSGKIPRNRPIFLWILTFLPRNQPIFQRIFTFFPRNQPIFPWICPWKSREILLFSAKYQKPCFVSYLNS